jgi:lincosamide nucleotidyltransferase A/C/D/E
MDEPSASTRRDFTSADVAEVLERLDAVSVPCWLDGGWGIDALLGTQTRTHDDLDLVVDANDLQRADTALGAVGFVHAQEVQPGLPARLVLVDGARRQVDLHPVRFDGARNGWQPLGEGAWAQYPAAGLTGRGHVQGRQVACVSADLQLRHHLGYPWDADDGATWKHWRLGLA